MYEYTVAEFSSNFLLRHLQLSVLTRNVFFRSDYVINNKLFLYKL